MKDEKTKLQKRLYTRMEKINKYQHLRCTFWISVMAIIVLIVSLIIPYPLWGSILQNIFAGLVTLNFLRISD